MMFHEISTSLMYLFMIIPLFLVGLLIYVLVRISQNNARPAAGGKSDALEILNQRFAKGEISDDEYTQKKKMLRE